MTLIMTLIRPEGVWLTTDHRITLNGKIVDDERPKQLTVFCPPQNTGPKFLLGFTGLADAPDGTPMMQWVRETIRGETRTIMQTLEHVRDRLTRDISGSSRTRRTPLAFGAGIFESPEGKGRWFGRRGTHGKRFYAEITNVDPKALTVERQFHLTVVEVNESMFFIGGSGASHVLSSPDFQLLQSQCRIRPAKWQDHLGLLAAINRRASAKTDTISPWCQGTFLSVDQEGAETRAFREPGDPPAPPQGLATILFGIDMTDQTEQMMRSIATGIPVSDEERDRMIRRGIEGRP